VVGVPASSNAWLDGSAVNIFAITDLKDGNFKRRVVDKVDDSKFALAHSVSVSIAGQLLAAVWPGICRQSLDPCDNPLTIDLGANCGEFFARRSLDENAI